MIKQKPKKGRLEEKLIKEIRENLKSNIRGKTGGEKGKKNILEGKGKLKIPRLNHN